MGCGSSVPSKNAKYEPGAVPSEVVKPVPSEVVKPGLSIPGCWIPEVAMRGITLPQLRAILEDVRQRCPEEEWEAGGGPKAGQPLAADEVNLYDTMKYVILPATKPYECSYVELVAKSPQKPRYFVSHWWGEAVALFIQCLEQHAEDRMFDENVAWWVCAYANNQYKLTAAVTSDPKESAFYQALCIVDGVVSVLDAHGTAFTRVWCVFEVWTALTGKLKADFKYDIYTAKDHQLYGHPRHAVGLVDGAAYHNHEPHTIQNQKKGDLEFGGYKVQREGHFPIELLHKALAIRLQDGQASVQADRRHILNTICGRGIEDLDVEPPSMHESYRKVNADLNGRVAFDTLATGLRASDEIFQAYMDAVVHSTRTELFLDINSFNLAKERQEKLVDALPVSLERIVIRGLSSIPESFGKLSNLKFCNLTHSRDLVALPDSVGSLTALEDLNLGGCKSLAALPESILQLKNLKVLNLQDCGALGTVPDFSSLQGLRVIR
mmetsp:Transcript_148774/g.370698  ORF Transcript_148774/g.370698 Transcript_148774/m.370698 type:complete len:493 (-) Transcript_148774:11-1489(-)